MHMSSLLILNRLVYARERRLPGVVAAGHVSQVSETGPRQQAGSGRAAVSAPAVYEQHAIPL